MDGITADGLGTIFEDALIEVVAISSGLRLDVSQAVQSSGFGDIIGVMSLNSSRSGLLFLSANEHDLRTICTAMTAVPEDIIEAEDLWDALSELLNMTAGNARLRLNGTEFMFALTTPFIITGSDMSIISKTRSTVISRELGNGDISITLKIAY